jgi:hypothetical protein
MDEMTWLLIGDYALDRFRGWNQFLLGEILREITHASAKSLRALGINGILLQQVTIFLEGGAAARGRDDDWVLPGPLEGIDGLPGEDARLFHHPGMDVKCATTLLLERDVDVGSISRYDARCGAVRVGKHRSHDAAVEEPRGAWLVLNRVGRPAFVPGTDRATGDLRRQSLQFFHPQ